MFRLVPRARAQKVYVPVVLDLKMHAFFGFNARDQIIDEGVKTDVCAVMGDIAEAVGARFFKLFARERYKIIAHGAKKFIHAVTVHELAEVGFLFREGLVKKERIAALRTDKIVFGRGGGQSGEKPGRANPAALAVRECVNAFGLGLLCA